MANRQSVGMDRRLATAPRHILGGGELASSFEPHTYEYKW